MAAALWIGASLQPVEGATDPGLSEVWVGDGELLGRLMLRDDIRPQAGPMLETLRQMGVHCVVLTGDRPAAAQALQRKLGLSDVRAELGGNHGGTGKDWAAWGLPAAGANS
jgi:P-type E1-E2 ATPase